MMTYDRGVHNLLRIHGVQLRYAGVEAAFQIGRTERQGGILKEVIKSAAVERQVVGVQSMKMLVMESSMVKNCRLNHHGFNPAQWVLGRLPVDATSLTAEEAEGRNLGVQEVQSGEDAFSQHLMIRQAAKQAMLRWTVPVEFVQHYFEKLYLYVGPTHLEIWFAFTGLRDGLDLGESLAERAGQHYG